MKVYRRPGQRKMLMALRTAATASTTFASDPSPEATTMKPGTLVIAVLAIGMGVGACVLGLVPSVIIAGTGWKVTLACGCAAA
jgi:hypothetical protein